MRIALVNPANRSHLQRHRFHVGHLGLAYVAACLQRDGFDVAIVDAKNELLDPDQVVDRLREIQPRLVGVTAMTPEIHTAAEICEGAKAAVPGCITMVGGPHATALPARTLDEFAGIDIAVKGEGEYTACEVARAVRESDRPSCRDIPGVAWRDGTEVVDNSDRPPIEDLDGLPLPAWELFPKPAGGWGIYASRGCPFQCAFCMRVLGGKVRLRNTASVIDEIEALHGRLGQDSGWFQDETFDVNRRWAGELLDAMLERRERTGVVWHWKANSRVNLADAGRYAKMKAAGCRVVDFGIESGSQQVLDRISKSIRLPQALNAVRMAREAGLKTNAFFIVGHPGETWSTALETARFAARLNTDSIAVGVMVPYPGTRIWEMAKQGQGGYRLLTEDWRLYDKYFGGALELRGLSHRQLQFLQTLTYASFYVGTGRWRDMFSFGRTYGREALEMARRIFLARSPVAGT